MVGAHCRTAGSTPRSQLPRTGCECQASARLPRSHGGGPEREEVHIRIQALCIEERHTEMALRGLVLGRKHHRHKGFKVIIGYIRNSCLQSWSMNAKNFQSRPMKQALSTGGLCTPIEMLATQWKTKFIWNWLMHYFSNNQESQFILQIIMAFVALMAKISQSSKQLTGHAFSGKW